VVLCALLCEAHSKVALRDNLTLQLTVRYLLRVTGFLEQADKTGGQDLVAAREKMLIDVHFPEKLVDVVLDAWTIGLGRVTDESIIGSIIALSEKFNTEMEKGELFCFFLSFFRAAFYRVFIAPSDAHESGSEWSDFSTVDTCPSSISNHSVTQSYSLTHSLTHSLTYSLQPMVMTNTRNKTDRLRQWSGRSSS
jgi:hypothetical protein